MGASVGLQRLDGRQEKAAREGGGGRVARVVAGLVAVIAVVVGLGLTVTGAASAGTAAADANGTWRAYGNVNPIKSSNSTWNCEGTRAVAPDVRAQVCAIRSHDGNSVQGAVIVRNDRSSLYRANAEVQLAVAINPDLWKVEGSWDCPTSGIGASSWSVCFTPTLTRWNGADATGSANGTWLGRSPWV